MEKALRIVVVGPPGCGKEVQAREIAKSYKLPFGSYRDILKYHLTQKTELGEEFLPFFQQKKAVPGELMNRMIRDVIDTKKGLVLKGYPITETQVQRFNEEFSPDICIFIRIPQDLARERLENRRIDDETSDVYNVKFDPPTSLEVTSRLRRSQSDSKSNIHKRLSSYYESSDFENSVVRKFDYVIELDGDEKKEVLFQKIREGIGRYLERKKSLEEMEGEGEEEEEEEEEEKKPERNIEKSGILPFSIVTAVLILLLSITSYFVIFSKKEILGTRTQKYLLWTLICYLVFKLAQRCVRYFRRKSFSGKVVLITGGANGLGKKLAERFLRERSSVVILFDIDQKNGEKTVKELTKMYSRDEDDYSPLIEFYKVDITDMKPVNFYAEKIRKEHGFVDVLVNNAGIVSKQTVFDSTPETIRKVMDVNILSHFWMIKAFCEDMVDQNRGHIVSIGSTASLAGVAGLNVYCASKFAVFGFLESLRLQFKRDNLNGIDTLIVMPYYMKGRMFEGVKSPIIPLLDMDFVADKVLQAMKDRELELVMPWWSRHIVYTVRLGLKAELGDLVQHALGITRSMDNVIKRK